MPLVSLDSRRGGGSRWSFLASGSHCWAVAAPIAASRWPPSPCCLAARVDDESTRASSCGWCCCTAMHVGWLSEQQRGRGRPAGGRRPTAASHALATLLARSLKDCNERRSPMAQKTKLIKFCCFETARWPDALNPRSVGPSLSHIAHASVHCRGNQSAGVMPLGWNAILTGNLSGCEPLPASSLTETRLSGSKGAGRTSAGRDLVGVLLHAHALPVHEATPLHVQRPVLPPEPPRRLSLGSSISDLQLWLVEGKHRRAVSVCVMGRHGVTYLGALARAVGAARRRGIQEVLLHAIVARVAMAAPDIKGPRRSHDLGTWPGTHTPRRGLGQGAMAAFLHRHEERGGDSPRAIT
jgi:hypothetical protein